MLILAFEVLIYFSIFNSLFIFKEGKIEFGKLLEFVSKEMEKYEGKNNKLRSCDDSSEAAKIAVKKSKTHYI